MTHPADNAVEPAGRLVVSRLIAASPERLFEVWTSPQHIQRWWGPAGVDCPYAEVDLRPGGAYRIANRVAGGTMVWITGVFETVSPPELLVYSWRTDQGSNSSERVTVMFVAQGELTEVSVTHELIRDDATMRSHESGWQGCLDGLAEYLGWKPLKRQHIDRPDRHPTHRRECSDLSGGRSVCQVE